MEGSTSEPASDWRSQVSNEFRQKLFKKIFDFMQKRVPVTQSTQGLIQLQNIVSQFEEKCFITATSQADYLRKVSIKMVSMEQKSQRTAGVGLSSKNLDVGNQNHNGPASSLTRPSHMQQQLLLQPNQFEPFKQPNTQLATSFQSGQLNIQSPMQCNRQQSQLNSIHRSSPSQVQHHQPVGRQQQNQLMVQQSNISTQQSQLPAQQNELTSMQLVRQHQSNSSQSGMQQQKQFIQSQRECPEVTSTIAVDSRANTINAGVADMQEEIYQKINSMKAMYLPELKEYYLEIVHRIQLFQASKPSGNQLEQYERTKIVKHNLEGIIKLLNISKDNIQSSLKEKISVVEKRIAIFIASRRSKKNVLLEFQGQQQFQQLGKHGQFMPEQQSSQNSPTHLNNHISSVEKVKLQGESAPVQSNINPTQKSSLGFLQNPVGAPLSQNTLQSDSSSMQPGSNVQQDQNLQFQIHEKQKLTQQFQTQIQPVPHLPVHQRSRPHHMNDGNEPMARRDSGIRSVLYRQNHTAIGHPNHYQQPKPGTPFQASPQKLQSPSPQIFRNLSSQNDWPKSGARSQHANSTIIVSSVPNAADTANIAYQQTSLRETQFQPLAILSPGISPSPLLEDFSSPQTCQVNALEAHLGELSATERPIAKLIKTMQSLSPETLSSCISNISSVVTMIDTMAGCVPGNGSRSEVGTDLSLTAWCNLQARNLMLQDGSSTKKRNHHITSMPLKASVRFDPIFGLDTSELESTATSNFKKQKSKINPSLLEEIKDINRKLIDTVVDINEDGVVKCSFTPVAFTSDLKSMLSQHQIMPLKLVAPSNYPDSSPVLLDELPDKAYEENEELYFKIQERFRRSLQCMSHPMSLQEMVRTWDSSIREVITEYAKKSGGGSFSSTYGGWQKCVTA